MNVIGIAAVKAGSVNRLAKEIGFAQPTLAKMGDGSNPLSPDVAAACAEYIGADPILAALEALRDQARTPDRRKAWDRRIAAVSKSKVGVGNDWSGRQDSNLRPLAPEASALPS